ncbi:hypothetical protein EVG20_g10429, partial [Dentipellis fragilis]
SGSARRDASADDQGGASAVNSQEGGNPRSAKDLKSSRSKERRRRGKDPLKDLSKGGKKLKDLLKTQSKRPTTASSDDSTTGAPVMPLPDKLDLRRTPSRSMSSRADSRPRSRSRPPPEDTTPKASPPSRDMDAADAPLDPSSQEPALAASASHAADTHTSQDEAVPSSSTLSLPPTTDPRPATPPPLTNGITTSSSPSSEASQASSLLHSSSSSQNPAWSSSSSYIDVTIPTTSAPTSSTTTTASPASSSTSRTRGKGSGSGSWDWDGQSTFYRDPPPRFAKFHNHHTRQAPPSPTTAAPLPLPYLSPSTEPPRHALSPSPSPGPSRPRRTPTPRLGPRGGETPPPALSSHTQIASLKGALEAAKMREEKNRLEAERLAKEVDVMRWRMNKDVGSWRRREMEMVNYIQYLSHNLNMYASGHGQQSNGQPPPSIPTQPSPGLPSAPFSPLSPSQIPQPPFSPSFGPFPPFSPPLPIVPSPTYSYPPAFAAQHHTLSTFFPGPAAPSSSGGSRSPPDRGRKRERRAVDGADQQVEEGVDVAYGEGGQEEEEEEFSLNDALAGAILKRPESLRVKTRRRGSASVGAGNVDVVEEIGIEGRAAEVEDEDFRFPSISDMGNVYIYREREADPVVADEEKNSATQEQEQEHEPATGNEVEGVVREVETSATVPMFNLGHEGG